MEQRSIELFVLLGGVAPKDFSGLPPEFRAFVHSIGYINVCAIMVIRDLSKGLSERFLATRYSLTRSGTSNKKAPGPWEGAIMPYLGLNTPICCVKLHNYFAIGFNFVTLIKNSEANAASRNGIPQAT